MKSRDENWAIDKPFCNLYSHRMDGELAYKTGQYNYPNGIITIYQQGYPYNKERQPTKLLTLTAYKGGRRWRRSFVGKVFTDIGIARKAGEFAREIESGWTIKQT